MAALVVVGAAVQTISLLVRGGIDAGGSPAPRRKDAGIHGRLVWVDRSDHDLLTYWNYALEFKLALDGSGRLRRCVGQGKGCARSSSRDLGLTARLGSRPDQIDRSGACESCSPTFGGANREQKAYLVLPPAGTVPVVDPEQIRWDLNESAKTQGRTQFGKRMR